MEPFLGFIVLTGPLFLIVLWVPVCIGLAVWVGRKVIKKNRLLKIAGGLAVFILAFFLPFGDEIAGRIYFNHLCVTEAGTKVYHAIVLPAEYWDEDGKPKFYDDRNGNLTLPINSIEWESKEEKYQFHIEKNSSLMKEKSSKLLNERTLFRYWGGWVVRNFSPHNTAISCGSNVAAYTNYVNQIFKSGISGQKGGK